MPSSPRPVVSGRAGPPLERGWPPGNLFSNLGRSRRLPAATVPFRGVGLGPGPGRLLGGYAVELEEDGVCRPADGRADEPPLLRGQGTPLGEADVDVEPVPVGPFAGIQDACDRPEGLVIDESPRKPPDIVGSRGELVLPGLPCRPGWCPGR